MPSFLSFEASSWSRAEPEAAVLHAAPTSASATTPRADASRMCLLPGESGTRRKPDERNVNDAQEAGRDRKNGGRRESSGLSGRGSMPAPARRSENQLGTKLATAALSWTR